MFYDNYRRLCRSVGKSPVGVAREIGLHQSSVTRWRNGSTPRESTLSEIAHYFDVTPDDLLYGEDNYDLYADEQSIVEMYRSLSPAGKTLMTDITNAIAKYQRSRG